MDGPEGFPRRMPDSEFKTIVVRNGKAAAYSNWEL
jgi:hypothetical protein